MFFGKNGDVLLDEVADVNLVSNFSVEGSDLHLLIGAFNLESGKVTTLESDALPSLFDFVENSLELFV